MMGPIRTGMSPRSRDPLTTMQKTGRGLPSVVARAESAEEPFRNWSGLSRWKPARLVEARTARDVADTVRAARAAGVRIRPVGAGKSFSEVTAARDDDWLLDVSAMKHIGPVRESDAGAATVTVGPGVVLRDLNEALDAAGYTLPTMTATNFQSIAGLVATNSRGSAYDQGGFSSLVESLEVVDGHGQIHRASRTENPELFDAVRSGLGLAGVITRVTLKVEKAFNYATHQRMERLDTLLDQRVIDRKNAENDFFQFFLFPYTGRAFVTEAKRTDAPAQKRNTWLQSFAIKYVDPLIKGVTSALPGLVPLSWQLTAGLAPNTQFVDKPHRSISMETPPYGQSGTESTGFFFPAEHTAEIMREVNRVLEEGRESGAYTTQYYGMVRFVRGDESYLSYAHSPDRTKRFGGLSIAYKPHPSHTGDFFGDLKRAIQRVLERHGKRDELTVHFGKLKDAFEPAELQRAYPGLERFREVRRRSDPDGVFLNPWAERWLGLGRDEKSTSRVA